MHGPTKVGNGAGFACAGSWTRYREAGRGRGEAIRDIGNRARDFWRNRGYRARVAFMPLTRGWVMADLESGKPWSDMDVFDLKNLLAHDDSFVEIASFLRRGPEFEPFICARENGRSLNYLGFGWPS